MGTGRDYGLFLTRSHGLARPRPNRPRVPIPVFVAPALLLQPTQTLRSRGCHQSVLHSALDRRLYSGMRQVYRMVAAALQHRAAAQRLGLSAPGARGAVLVQACNVPPIGARVTYCAPELTSEWTNQWGQARTACPCARMLIAIEEDLRATAGWNVVHFGASPRFRLDMSAGEGALYPGKDGVGECRQVYGGIRSLCTSPTARDCRGQLCLCKTLPIVRSPSLLRPVPNQWK